MNLPWAIAAIVLVLNLPFGFLRAGMRRFTWRWFAAIHLPVPMVIGLRIWAGVPWHPLTVLLLAAAMCSGQFLGGQIRHHWHGPV